MFSVLIMNKKTTESFNEYYPLFLDAIKENNIAPCRWYESGSDIDSILPDLHDITDDKKEWRAVIVKIEDDSDNHPTMIDNPFDYICNSEKSDDVTESPIPLIRLTHYLGGFPASNVQFVPEEVKNEGKATKVVYKLCKNEENDEKHRHLSEKYDFDGHHPSEIIIFTLRKNYSSETLKNVKSVWTDYIEINSSDFWKRNNYPSTCRFVIYDLKNEGPIQREADMFSFWTSIFLMSTNEINPNYLQAYRLYKINVDYSYNSMNDGMQSIVRHLIGCRHYLENDIEMSIKAKLNEEKKLPNYEVNIPVIIEAPSKAKFGIDKKRFSLTPSSVIEENVLWGNMKNEALNKVDECIKNSEIALDKSAESMRKACDFPTELINPLDDYQKRDMETDLSNVYSKIIINQGTLPKSSVEFQDKLAPKEEKVKKDFVERVKTSQSIKIINLLAIVLFVGLIPAVYNYVSDSLGDLKLIVGIFAISLLFLGIVELIVLLVQKSSFNKDIELYNDGLEEAVGELKNNSKVYSNFISLIATYIKGKTYLKKLSQIKFDDENAFYMQRQHISAINNLLSKINRWSVAFNLDVSFDVDDELNYAVDFSINPQLSSIYSFNSRKNKEIPVNKSGDHINSPFDFVNKINLEREDIYDEYRN